MKKYRALGLTCGVGSMLIGASRAGFEIVGNIEWRKYYHTGTFERNFPGSFMIHSLDVLEEIPLNIDLIMGHPECGNYSIFNRRRMEGRKSPSDIPLFMSGVKRIKPRFFAMDNLPESLISVPMSAWISEFPEYDLFPEWVSNYNYGNVQKNRNRLFIIGALKSEKFVFVPDEEENHVTVKDTIGDLYRKAVSYENRDKAIIPNHILKAPWMKTALSCLQYSTGGRNITVEEAVDMFKGLRTGECPTYLAKDGVMKRKIGRLKTYWDRHSHTVSGDETLFHPLTNYPLTLRELARLQGCPDDFVFEMPDKVLMGRDMYRQVGKFMPVQFCEFLSRQIMDHLQGKSKKGSGIRLIRPKPIIDEAKREYCMTVGSRGDICANCWISGCVIQRDGRVSRLDRISEVISQAIEPCRTHVEGPNLTSKEKVLMLPLTSEKPPKRTISKVKSMKYENNVLILERVNVERLKKPPKDYHCNCKFCKKFDGLLIREDGSYYSKRERRKYYCAEEMEHGALTPVHFARFCIQNFTEEGDWVLDPTIGCGTSAVESLRQKRNIAGVELEFFDITMKNIEINNPFIMNHCIREGDARNLKKLLQDVKKKKFRLVLNNPPYSGDQRERAIRGGDLTEKERVFRYTNDQNLAKLNEGDEYFETIENVYRQCFDLLLPGGRFAIAVKDMVRDKKNYLLHYYLGEVLDKFMVFESMFLLPHYPPTLFMSTYNKRFPELGLKIPRYQTILIFRKEGG